MRYLAENIFFAGAGVEIFHEKYLRFLNITSKMSASVPYISWRIFNFLKRLKRYFTGNILVSVAADEMSHGESIRSRCG